MIGPVPDEIVRRLEGRVELAQAKRGSWQGAIGGQLLIRNFDSVGEERFVPKNRTVQAGLFTLQEVAIGPVRLEAGGIVRTQTVVRAR